MMPKRQEAFRADYRTPDLSLVQRVAARLRRLCDWCRRARLCHSTHPQPEAGSNGRSCRWSFSPATRSSGGYIALSCTGRHRLHGDLSSTHLGASPVLHRQRADDRRHQGFPHHLFPALRAGHLHRAFGPARPHSRRAVLGECRAPADLHDGGHLSQLRVLPLGLSRQGRPAHPSCPVHEHDPPASHRPSQPGDHDGEELQSDLPDRRLAVRYHRSRSWPPRPCLPTVTTPGMCAPISRKPAPVSTSPEPPQCGHECDRQGGGDSDTAQTLARLARWRHRHRARRIRARPAIGGAMPARRRSPLVSPSRSPSQPGSASPISEAAPAI